MIRGPASEWHRAHKEIGIDFIRHMVPGKKTYIGQLEAAAAASVLETLPPDMLQDRQVMMWIDNLSAKYGLQKGYSKVADSGRIVNAFGVKRAALRCDIWFEYVPSEQNIADLPSRGRLAELEVIMELVSGSDWECVYYPELKLPDVSSWSAHLRAVRAIGGGSPRRAHGSRGSKRPRP